MVSFEMNRGKRCFDSETFGSIALGGCSATHTDNPRQRERADHPVGLFRLLYWLGGDTHCPICLSASKALGAEPPTGVIPSMHPPCAPRPSDRQPAPCPPSVACLYQ